MKNICVTTQIKVNLALHVTGQRENGYHELDSLVAFCHSGDQISLKIFDKDALTIDGLYGAGLDTGQGNLICQALDKLRLFYLEKYQGQLPFISMNLTKNLPLASGIGGGSGDAAAVIYGLNQLCKLNLNKKEQLSLALQLGADVPICLSALYDSSARVMQGIGEKMTPLHHFPKLHLVLVNPGVALSTPAVFNALMQKNNASLHLNAENYKNKNALLCFLKQSRNDLLGPALTMAPQINDVLRTLDKYGAEFSRMSGSGATCFGIFENKESAQKAALSIKEVFPNWYVSATQTEG